MLGAKRSPLFQTALPDGVGQALSLALADIQPGSGVVLDSGTGRWT